MSSKSSRRRRSRKKNTSTKKGRVVEKIVAMLHDWPNVKVERNVYLPALGNSSRRREIDVLLTTEVVGYPVRIAIECKNEKKPIGSPAIDAFVGKLQDVGIPTQHGIFVSASGFTSRGGAAIARAKEAGIRALVLDGLSKEGLSKHISSAFQSVIYLLAEVSLIQVTNMVASTDNPYQMLTFCDKSGKLCGSIPDLVWQKWLNGYPPSKFGEYVLNVEPPSDWYQVIDGKIEEAKLISVKIRVTGFMLTLMGKIQKYSLINAENESIEKSQFRAIFEVSQSRYPLTVIQTEDQLVEFINRPEPVAIISRVRLPRIRVGATYWPPSERAAKIVIALMQAYEAGEIEDPRPIDIIEIEGSDLKTIFEPIWKEHPSIQKG